MGSARWLAPIGALLVTACAAGALNGDPYAYLAGLEIRRPGAAAVTVCHAYNCKQRTRIAFSDADMAAVADLMTAGQDSPSAERRAVSRAIAWFERRVAPETGLAGDRGYEDLFSDGDPTQTDCIDEAANATAYLLLLQERGLLRHHRVAHPVSKGFLLDGRYPHTSAVLVERQSQHLFSVDSWVMANGQEPIIVKLDEWLARRSADLVARSGNPA